MKKKKWLGVAGLALSIALCGTAVACGGGGTPPGSEGDTYEDYNPSKNPGGNQFDYNGNFTEPELTVDGVADEEIWQNTPVLATFGKAASVKVYRGNSALFFYFDVQDSILLTEGETNDDAVTRSDSIELYLDTNADGGSMPMSDDFQLNLAIHGKTRITKGAGAPRSWGTWNGLVDYEVNLKGESTLNNGTEANDEGYSVEVMIPYSELMIEKDTTIGVAFAQVDKVGTGKEDNIDWTWNGWTYDGVFVEPQTIDNYVLMSYHPDDKENPNHLTIRDKVPMPAATVEGTVKDEDGNFIEGATVTLRGTDKTATTDALGHFFIENVDSEGTYTAIVEKNGYLAAQLEYTRAELRKANGGSVSKEFTLTSTATLTYTTLKGRVKNLIDGYVGGATITVKNTTITTTAEADGTFSLANVPANNGAVTIVVTKAGYGDSETVIPEDQLEGDTVLGDVNLNLPWGNTGDGAFGNKSAFFATNTAYISRALTGIEFRLTGTAKLNGKVEIYLDTKNPVDPRESDSTCWRFDLQDNGWIWGTHYTGSDDENNNFSQQGYEKGIIYNLIKNTDSGYEAYFFIPYTYLDITPLEVFGISLGQYSSTADDWDGWGYNGFIAPENPTNYVRIGATNNLYKANNNQSTVTLSGNAGQAGVTVSVGGQSVMTAADGAWSMIVPSASAEMTVTFSKQGYVTKTETIEAGYFDSHFTWDKDVALVEEEVTIDGTVTDDATKDPIANVTVTVTAGGETVATATTGADGTYTLTIGTFNDVVIKFEAEGYASREVEKTAQALSQEAPHKISMALIPTSNIEYITVSGTVTNVNGPVEGATVTVVGNSALTATTNANGEFTIADFAGIDCDLTVEKAGYITQTLKFKQEDIDGDSYEFAEQDMPLEYKKLNGVIAPDDGYGAFTGSFTRSAVGFEFKFVSAKDREFNGRIELFVDTKTSTGIDARDTSDYLFNLNADKTITIVNWGEGEKNEAVPENMVLTVKNADTALEVYFTLPYAFFGQKNADAGITATEVIGISAGQYNGSSWNGWYCEEYFGVNNEAFVKPEWTQDYIRLGAHNEVYASENNDIVDYFSSYDIHFGARPTQDFPADNFYAKVSSRNENGVTFSFISKGDFGTRGEDKEMILIYFDTGETVDGWNNVNYLIKIASDGTVYGSNGHNNSGDINNPGTGNEGSASWWSANDNFKLNITATINRENGITTVELTVPYSVLGIGANDVFGIAMREASHNAGDHDLYNPWHDCYFNGEQTDAANSSQYIRVAADGTLYKANHN